MSESMAEGLQRDTARGLLEYSQGLEHLGRERFGALAGVAEPLTLVDRRATAAQFIRAFDEESAEVRTTATTEW